MKEVKNHHSKKKGIVNFYLTTYYHISQGLNPSQIAKKYNFSKQKISYYTRKLEKEGVIKKVGYGTWETTNKQVKDYYKDGEQNFNFSKDIRGHGFQFKLVIKNDLKNWKKRVEFLTKNNINYSLVGNKGSIIRIIYKKHKIWLCNKSIIIYYPRNMSFFGRSAKNSRRNAIHDFYSIIKSLERYLHADFKIRGKYLFKITKHHYALIRSELAGYYLKEGKKLEVRTDEGDLWLLIDNSLNLKETEAVLTKTAVKDMDNIVNPFMNTLRRNPLILDELINTNNEMLLRLKAMSETQMSSTMLSEQFSKNIDKLVTNQLKIFKIVEQREEK